MRQRQQDDRHMREPVISPAADGSRYVLCRDMDYFGVVIPAGFEFDGARIPRFFWRCATPFEPRLIRAACGHDYMYVNAIWTKADADRLFREALIIDGVPRWLAGIMHKAVRFGGRGAYKKGG